jgi:two-component system, NtrC family, response regulator HydG
VRIRPFDRELPRDVCDDEEFPEIDGASAPVLALKRDMRRVASDPYVTVLITGESGTGKERVAEAIHRASPRAASPFVVIDCAGLSTTLAEDALFGHVRGAFTGAVDDRAGPFERADGGSLLLDEIGDLPLDVQMKLLRAIQSRTVQRLGGSGSRRFDVRVMAATHVDLTSAVARGRFREDLYYRLRVYELTVPPLRRRGAADIRALAAAIVARLARRRGRAVPAIDAPALDVLAEHTWPGNVRELENVLERMVVAAGGEPVLGTTHMPRQLRAHGMTTLAPQASTVTVDQIVGSLQRNGFRYGRTAADLGLSRHRLYRLLKRHGIPCRGPDR